MQYQHLLERCKKKDASAQRILYDLFKARLMGLCRRYAKDREDAKDMLQESFIKIFSKIEQVTDATKLESWMKSVAVRTAIDHYHRSRKKDQSLYTSTEYDVAGIDTEDILANLSDEFLITVINELPSGCRVVFNLFEVEGYNHTEIAALLGVTEGTSRSQLHHAKYLLKEKLNRIGIKRYEKLA
ncbi:MAG TPA: RNA polymerase sigma factor [Ohtaekwangia sp.]|uniref:RNA polymerase sigma factor n=1 Tax=Ohtaekwangia sp. TaxID=2066019 RepID=UPI002F947E7E